MANLSASAVRRTKRNSRHGRIYRRRYRLPWDKFLWNKYLSSYLPARRHKALSRRNQLLLELKRECQRKRKFMRETLELKHALMPLERSGRLAASSAPSLEARARVLCECCFATIKIDEYGDSPHEKCKECQRLLCSNCCFASEKAPLWYCRMCVVTKRLLPIWRPTTEGRHDRVLSVSIQVRRRGRVYGEAMLA